MAAGVTGETGETGVLGDVGVPGTLTLAEKEHDGVEDEQLANRSGVSARSGSCRDGGGTPSESR